MKENFANSDEDRARWSEMEQQLAELIYANEREEEERRLADELRELG